MCLHIQDNSGHDISAVFFGLAAAKDTVLSRSVEKKLGNKRLDISLCIGSIASIYTQSDIFVWYLHSIVGLRRSKCVRMSPATVARVPMLVV